jgi:sensor c-di-GMP phosphodiesterase-like protein
MPQFAFINFAKKNSSQVIKVAIKLFFYVMVVSLDLNYKFSQVCVMCVLRPKPKRLQEQLENERIFFICLAVLHFLGILRPYMRILLRQ